MINKLQGFDVLIIIRRFLDEDPIADVQHPHSRACLLK